MQHKIIGDDVQAVVLNLQPGQVARAAAGNILSGE